jgi:hypothetical protein
VSQCPNIVGALRLPGRIVKSQRKTMQVLVHV